MAEDTVLAVVAVARFTKSDWKAMVDQERFMFYYDERKIMLVSAKPPVVRHSASGAEVRDGGRLEVRTRY